MDDEDPWKDVDAAALWREIEKMRERHLKSMGLKDTPRPRKIDPKLIDPEILK